MKIRIGNKIALAAAIVWALSSGVNLLLGQWLDAFSAFAVTLVFLVGVDPALATKEEAHDPTP